MTPAPSAASPANSNTLGEFPSASWQRIQRSKPVAEFSRRERDFINESLSIKPNPNIIGTKLTYVKPEGEDKHSMYSKDDDDDEAPGASIEINPQHKQRFKNIVKRLYPAKVVGGAKAVSGAFRHPMATTRKVNRYMSRPGRKNAGATRSLAEELPHLTRRATMTEIHEGTKKTNTNAGSCDILLHFC